ncbi:MAG: hypothetical protein A3I75_01535 [Deltaproteobacteria bacterium RIFCSPLOWO2_02_FULL_50_16]|nr:MAG: hypothetical protein A3I75_01535 [Deltaproteobacteria bacterium RIFCSPLOWO2_02_FULL_50_16]
MLLVLVMGGSAAAYLTLLWFRLPDPAALREANPQITSFILSKCAKRPCSIEWTPLDQISPFVPRAVVLAEDIRFFRHHGFDWTSLKKAMKANWQRGKIVWGASTLTMQLAKNLYLSPEKTLGRKLREAMLTIKLERSLPKERILEIYLNVAEWGPSVFGITAASEKYFMKAPHDLGPLEASFLASILPNPQRAEEPGWYDHFMKVGSRLFDTLLQTYLPPMHPLLKGDPCQEFLSPKEAFRIDYLIAKIFSLYATDILSGEAALLTEATLMQALTEEEQVFVNTLLTHLRETQTFQPLSCPRPEAPSRDLFTPITQYDSFGQGQYFLIPLSMAPALQRLFDEARQDGFPLVLRSAYRNAGYQIYVLLSTLRQNNYCFSRTARQVAAPEKSEHGCVDQGAVDFGILDEREGSFGKTGAFSWLQNNAPSLGFYLSYPPDNKEGMMAEPWHWRFVNKP